MKTIKLSKNAQSVSRYDESLFLDDSNDGDFDENWLISANDLFGSFSAPTDELNSFAYYDQAA